MSIGLSARWTLVVGLALLLVGCTSSASAPSLDPSLLADRQSVLDDMAVSSNCDHLRAALSASQLLLDGEDRDDAHAYARELEQTANTQMDRMRC